MIVLLGTSVCISAFCFDSVVAILLKNKFIKKLENKISKIITGILMRIIKLIGVEKVQYDEVKN